MILAKHCIFPSLTPPNSLVFFDIEHRDGLDKTNIPILTDSVVEARYYILVKQNFIINHMQHQAHKRTEEGF